MIRTLSAYNAFFLFRPLMILGYKKAYQVYDDKFQAIESIFQVLMPLSILCEFKNSLYADWIIEKNSPLLIAIEGV